MSIKFYNEDISYRVREIRKIKRLLTEVILDEKKKPGDLCFIMTSDEYLLRINKEYLKREYYTDVIAFDYSDDFFINGDIFISRERVKENSVNYKVSFRTELLRVMIHGVLHLCGYRDKDESERREMRKGEERYLIIAKEKHDIRI